MSKKVLIAVRENVDVGDIGCEVVGLNNYHGVDINCFIPSEHPIDSKDHLCFIPFSKTHDWDYKQQARAKRYMLGNDNCRVIGTEFTYPVHKKVGLSYNEQVDLTILAIEFFLEEGYHVILSHNINLLGKQAHYLEQLVDNKKVEILYGD